MNKLPKKILGTCLLTLVVTFICGNPQDAFAQATCPADYARVNETYPTGVTLLCKSKNGAVMRFNTDGTVNTCDIGGNCLTTRASNTQVTNSAATGANTSSATPTIPTCSDGSQPQLLNVVDGPGGSAAFVCPNANADGTHDMFDPSTGQKVDPATLRSQPNIKECQKAGITSGDGIVNGFKCAGLTIIITLSAATISITTSLLDLTDYLFNLAIQSTVLNFNSLYESIQKQVTQIWTLFRDFANILIIGLFVFIAISIILGLQEYGQKKLIARVIIIAILINFSFLFTIIAINTSNAIAASIYNGTMAPIVQSLGSRESGVADVFKKMLKTASVKESTGAMVSMYNDTNGGLATILMHTFTAIIFQLSAALVFLYGALLLAARFIILILLLVVSAAAFASYLSPTFADGEYGWSAWWHQLLRNSFFAPVLMIFLFAAMQIAIGISAKSTSLGALASAGGVADPLAVSTALNYILILGFLAVGIYISSHLAAGAARRFSAFGTMLPGAIVARGMIAPAARRFIGGAAAASGHALEQGMKTHAQKMATLNLKDPEQAKEYKKLRNEWMNMSRQKGRRDFLAKSSFDLMNTKAMQKVGAAAGLGGALAGKSDKSYEKSSHAQVEAGLKEAMKAVITDKKATELARDEHRDDSGEIAIERQHKDNMEILKAAKETASAAKEGAGMTRKLADHEADISRATKDKAELATRFAKGEVTETEHKTAMTAINKRIEEAQKKASEVTALMRDIDAPVRDAQQKVSRSAAALKEFNDSLKERGREIQQRSVENAQNLAPAFAGGRGIRSLYRGTSWHPDSYVVHELREKISSKGRPERLKQAQREKEKKEDAPKDEHAHDTKPAGGDSGGEKKH